MLIELLDNSKRLAEIELNKRSTFTDNGVCSVVNSDLSKVLRKEAENIHLIDSLNKLNNGEGAEQRRLYYPSVLGYSNSLTFHIMGPRNFAMENVFSPFKERVENRDRKFQVSTGCS